VSEASCRKSTSQWKGCFAGKDAAAEKQLEIDEAMDREKGDMHALGREKSCFFRLSPDGEEEIKSNQIKSRRQLTGAASSFRL